MKLINPRLLCTLILCIMTSQLSGQCFGFEAWWDIGLANSPGQDLNWQIHSGATPSPSTGPNSASSGNYYYYIEGSDYGVGYPAKGAQGVMNINSGVHAQISFDYHMYGSNIGGLYLYTGGQIPFIKQGNQGNSWHSVVVDIPVGMNKTGTVWFLAYTGSGYRSDIAIDNLCISYPNSRLANPNPNPNSNPTALSADIEEMLNRISKQAPSMPIQAYPNPFTTSTTIQYTLPEATEVVLTIKDVTGREVARLINGETQSAGVHKAVFNAADNPAGIYFYTLEAKGIRKTGKLILQR